MKPELIIMSYGDIAKETLKSAEMVVGEIPNVNVISMSDEYDFSETIDTLKDLLYELDNYQVLIITELLGKTPCNIAMSMLYEKDNIAVVSGLNQSILIEYAMSLIEDLDELANHLVKVGGEGIYKIKITKLEDEDECAL